MMARWYEDLFPVVEGLGIAHVAFFPMANGFLTGGYSKDPVFEQGSDHRSDLPQYTAEEIAAIDRKLDTMTIPVFGGY